MNNQSKPMKINEHLWKSRNDYAVLAEWQARAPTKPTHMGSPPAATNGMFDDYVIEDRERVFKFGSIFTKEAGKAADVQQLFKHKDMFGKLAGFKRINDSDFIPSIKDTTQRFWPTMRCEKDL